MGVLRVGISGHTGDVIIGRDANHEVRAIDINDSWAPIVVYCFLFFCVYGLIKTKWRPRGVVAEAG